MSRDLTVLSAPLLLTPFSYLVTRPSFGPTLQRTQTPTRLVAIYYLIITRHSCILIRGTLTSSLFVCFFFISFPGL